MQNNAVGEVQTNNECVNVDSDRSVIKNTALYDILRSGRGNVDACREIDLHAAADIFVKESVQALGISPIDSSAVVERFENVRPFILKTLLFIGVDTVGNKLPLTARLIHRLALHPEVGVSQAMNDLAKRARLNYTTISRIVDEALNVYDGFITKNISFLTKSVPVTSRDALADIALYVRTKIDGADV